MGPVHRFPRSLAPLPDETLPGMLLRMSHRLEQSPLHITRLSGLARGRHSGDRDLSAKVMISLPPHIAEALAHSWRLTPGEAHRLTIAPATPNYPPLQAPYVHTHRDYTNLVLEGTVLVRSTRYCPPCLAGEDVPVQRDHGGAWRRAWRLPIVFACPRHHRMLDTHCPECGNLV